ncbi:MAG: hypothetical protein ACKVQK_06080 [Burkholderiales bacterium]
MHQSDFVPVSRPLLADLASCDRWLARERITDSGRACSSFIALLDQLEDAPPDAKTFAQILERLRIPMHAALGEQTRRFACKALPLAAAEVATLRNARDLWLAQIRAWQRLQRTALKTKQTESNLAHVMLRTLESIVGLMSTLLAARQQIQAEYWRWLHQSYALCEKETLLEVVVPDETGDGGLSCLQLYVRILMLHLANPATLSQREFDWVARWTNRWARKVTLSTAAERESGLAVDLGGETGATWTHEFHGKMSIRFLHCATLRHSIRSRIKKLDAGATPADLNLGKDCPPSAARTLLEKLLNDWGDAPRARQFPRRDAAGKIELVSGFAGIRRALSADNQEDEDISPWRYTRQQVEEIHLFQRVAKGLGAQKTEANQEHWEILDESANGFGLRRSLVGSRLAHGQLVAVRPQGASQFIFCDVRWLSQSAENNAPTLPRGEAKLCIGAKAMPGMPQACGVRSLADSPASGGAWSVAFVLSLSKGLAPQIVLPLGWYQAEREVEIKFQQSRFRVRLEQILARGYDYQRVSFATLAGI